MVRRILVHSVIGMASIGFGFTGVASASSSIGLTGPHSTNRIFMSNNNSTTLHNTNNVWTSNSNNQRATSGSVSSSGNTANGWDNGGQGSGWGSWDPETWQASGRGFSQWWGGAMGNMDQEMNSWNSNDRDSEWSPSGEGWQNNWSSWDPQVWQSNGCSWSNWHRQMTEHMTHNFNNWMNNWGGGQGNTESANLGSGNAANDQNTTTGVDISNGGNGGNFGGNGGNGSAQIFRTGPHSTNVIDESSRDTVSLRNDNNVTTTNQNNQLAESGSVNVSENTIAGDASSGSVSNSNNTNNNISITNSANGSANFGSNSSGSGNGDAFIGTTGPGSTNRISENNSNQFSQTNNNRVSTTNSSTQTARSGNVTQSENTIAGDASSGSAHNSNNTSTSVSISN